MTGTFAFAMIVLPDTIMLAACVVLTLAVLIFVFWIEPDAADSAPHRSQLDQLLERRDSIYENLRDLKFENRAGKYAEQDYEQMRDSLENEAAQVLLEIENVTGNEAHLARRDPVISAPPRE
jgi:type II secretory pathway component PulM